MIVASHHHGLVSAFASPPPRCHHATLKPSFTSPPPRSHHHNGLNPSWRWHPLRACRNRCCSVFVSLSLDFAFSRFLDLSLSFSLPPAIPLFLSRSLSHTHTHTHTRSPLHHHGHYPEGSRFKVWGLSSFSSSVSKCVSVPALFRILLHCARASS